MYLGLMIENKNRCTVTAVNAGPSRPFFKVVYDSLGVVSVVYLDRGTMRLADNMHPVVIPRLAILLSNQNGYQLETLRDRRLPSKATEKMENDLQRWPMPM